MAVFATGLTKFLAASNPVTRNPAQSASTIVRFLNGKDCIRLIIRWESRPPPLRRFRMAQLELPSLQSVARRGTAGEPALLALPDPAPRQVSHRVCRAYRTGSRTLRHAGFAAQASYLGSCRFCG